MDSFPTERLRVHEDAADRIAAQAKGRALVSPRPVIGIDIGFSRARRSCGLGVMHCSLPFQSQRCYGKADIRVGTLRLAELVSQLRAWRATPEHARELDKAVVIIDGPVGQETACAGNRAVDQWFSSGAFRLHCPPYQVEQAAEFVSATEKVIEALAWKPDEGCSRPFVWMKEPLPSRQIVIAETNPTVVLAMSMPRGKPEYLVSRSKPRNVGGRVVRSKSDWYWACGARFSIASALNADDAVNETDHDRIAALVCLTVGEQLSGQALDGGSAVAIGGSDGVYVLPSRCHADWQDALERMIYYGAVDRRGVDVPLAPEWNTPTKVEEVSHSNRPTRVPLEEGPRQEQTAQVNSQLLRLTDTGALHATANPWLRGLSREVTVVATKIGRVVLTEGAAGWKLQPTAATIARALDFPLPLSKARPLEIEIELVASRQLPGNNG